MASSELLQELIRAHVSGDAERFRRIALQVAAREARSGHRLVAGRIRDLVEEADEAPPPTPIARPPRDLAGLLEVTYPDVQLDHVVLEGEAEAVVSRLLAEHVARASLAEWGLEPRRRLLFYGPPGCGKTMTASAIANELALPRMRVRIETLFSRYMGETAGVLTEVFEHAKRQRGVYLFDEFDAIAKHRSDDRDVGEARRVVSAFLQLLDSDESESVLIAATNERHALDPALFRRFDDVALFDAPSERARLRLLGLLTASHDFSEATRCALAKSSDGLTDAEITRAVTDAVKAMVLDGRKRLRKTDVEAALDEVGRRSNSD